MARRFEYRCEQYSEADESLEHAVNLILRSYNLSANPVWWDKLSDPANDPRRLNIFAFGTSQELVGGLLGETCLSWLKVHIMAVQEEHRGRGLGIQMLDLAEAEAIERGCSYAFLDTMQYQAPEFYKSRGYEVAGMIPEWDSHGHAKYFMTKTLVARDA